MIGSDSCFERDAHGEHTMRLRLWQARRALCEEDTR
jgi:hypothetical protein